MVKVPLGREVKRAVKGEVIWFFYVTLSGYGLFWVST
jgi:hypothetical protein